MKGFMSFQEKIYYEHFSVMIMDMFKMFKKTLCEKKWRISRQLSECHLYLLISSNR